MGSAEPAINTAANPAVPLADYQRNWVNDTSRFKIGAVTRQGGKSFEATLEAALDAPESGNDWVILSAGERQSKEAISKAKLHTRAIGAVFQEHETEFWTPSGITYKQLEVVIPNGARIIGLPANPDTARGWSANILLDEFALHRDSREIWKAMFPTVTRGYKVRVISTFKGRNNKFHELMYGAPTKQRFTGPDFEYVGERGGWSKHFVDIYMAVAMGLKLIDEEGKLIEPEDLRLALNDDDAWEEEFMCVPSDEVSAFLTHELISAVEDLKLEKDPAWIYKLIEAAGANYTVYKRTKVRPEPPADVLRNVEFMGRLFVGMDIGRKKDLSVIWVDQEIDNVLRTAAVIELKRTPYFIQEQVLYTILGRKEFFRACIDETGIGAQLAEGAQDRFGASRVEGISFTSESKETLAVGLKQNFEDGGSQIPADNTIRSSLHSVKKYATTTKHFRFDAERTDTTGHADHFWAKALAVQAAQSGVKAACVGRDRIEQEGIMIRPGRVAGAGGLWGRYANSVRAMIGGRR